MKVTFKIGANRPPAVSGKVLIYLRRSSWNDYGFGTTFEASVSYSGDWQPLGVVKIGQRGLRPSHELSPAVHTSYVELPSDFSEVSEEHFSLGQDADYYEVLVETLGVDVAFKVLTALRDVAVLPGLFEEVRGEDVLQSSLMRSVSSRSLHQYRLIISGQQPKEDFHLRYKFRPRSVSGPEVTFRVERGRPLPSNVHVLIGSNGTGKTTTLSNIRWAFEDRLTESDPDSPIDLSDKSQITSLLSISFSAFDTFPNRARMRREQLDFRITNVRLPWLADNSEPVTSTQDARVPREIEMGNYVASETMGCLAERSERLLAALRLLADADPVLDRHGVATAAGLEALDFSLLSSGHKIAILMVATLVRYCEEKTLVLVDEPESHLHPPLLGAVTRALSDLMVTINGLAVVATHSPVVLQEVPRRCAWIISSDGNGIKVEQPILETFGANLGVLTREVFDLELSRSGYHALLRQVADTSDSFEGALSSLDGEIGDEAKLLLRSMIRRREGTAW
ncbi:AAA family ATPase [Plantibacter sp. MPB07]|uniref:AAA family ATPase n=1 Tax=Plantibacter sp. MPB07 TaxID=3388853 RepID=UPI003987EE3C